MSCLLVVVKRKCSRKIRNIFLYLFLANLYTCVDSWPDTKSLPSQLGEIGGLALNKANDELVVFHRGSRKWENK
jgi:hypothetical protein